MLTLHSLRRAGSVNSPQARASHTAKLEADIQATSKSGFFLRRCMAVPSLEGLVKWQLLRGCRVQKCELWDDHVIALSILRARRDDVLSNRTNDGLTCFQDFGPGRVAKDFIFNT
jgi:hypothetical protein